VTITVTAEQELSSPDFLVQSMEDFTLQQSGRMEVGLFRPTSCDLHDSGLFLMMPLFWHPCPYSREKRTSAGGCLLHILFVFSPGFLHLASLPETQAWILWLYIFLSRIPVSSFPLLRLMIPKKYQSAPN